MATERTVETVITADEDGFKDGEIMEAIKAAKEAALDQTSKTTVGEEPQVRIRGVKKRTC